MILKPQKPDLKCPPLRSGQYLAEKLFCVCRGLRKNEPSQALRASSPEGRAKTVEGAFLASPFGRGGCDHREQMERAYPLPCGELPPQRPRGLQIGEARKMLLAKRLAFFRFDFSFGVERGEQPLSRESSASKSLALFWFSFVRQKRTNSARLQRVEIAATLPR